MLEQENEVLRRAAAICPRRTCREMEFPLVREVAAVGTGIRVPVAVACRVLGRSAQG